jgi:hypothetical protein
MVGYAVGILFQDTKCCKLIINYLKMEVKGVRLSGFQEYKRAHERAYERSGYRQLY